LLIPEYSNIKNQGTSVVRIGQHEIDSVHTRQNDIMHTADSS